MNLTIIKVFILFVLVSVSSYAAKWVTPEIEVSVVDRQSGKPVTGVEVTLGVRKKWLGAYRNLGQAETDKRGKTLLQGVKTSKFAWLGLGFHWEEPGLPARDIYVEIRARKGSKTAGRRHIRPGRKQSGYVIEEKAGGTCNSLFTVEGDGKHLRVVFHRPHTYLECEEQSGKHRDMNNIGTRDINKNNLNIYKFDDDKRMGGEFFGQIKKTKENPPLKDRRVNAYVKNMVDRIVSASDMPDLDFQVTVIDADVVNAFAVPGGYIFVYRGLIESTETEAELAGVIAHEIAHVTGRHGTEGMTSAISKLSLGLIAAEVAASQMKENQAVVRDLTQSLILAGTQFWVIGGTRKREAEADQLGAQYAYRAGYDPKGIATLFERWAEKRGKPQTRLDQFFSDHPNDRARANGVRRDVGYFMVPKPGLTVSSSQYKAIKKRLKQLPPPKVSGKAAGNSLFSTIKTLNEQLILDEIGAYYAEKKEE